MNSSKILKNIFSNTRKLLQQPIGNRPVYHRTKDISRPPTVYATAEEAVAPYVQSNQTIYLHMAASTPTELLRGVVAHKDRLENVKFQHMSIDGPPLHLDPSIPESKFKSVCMFVSGNVRKFVQSGRCEYMPIFFSEVPIAFRERRIPLDIALVQISPPDANGWCSLGVSVDCSLAAVHSAKYVIGQINREVPRTHGDSFVHINMFDSVIEKDTPLYANEVEELTDVDRAIGKHCASLIPDGATLQMGIGSIPNAVLASLTGHKDLGVHTELFSDGVLPLVQSGVINNSKKKTYPHRLVSTFLTGSKKLYNFVNDNPCVAMIDVEMVNNPVLISKNPAVHAINSAIEVDLTGQVCADSIGLKIYSGIGGQMDFMRGAGLSQGGKPIIALPSTTSRGESKIVPTLKPGAGVVTTRGHVHYVVTEYGIAELRNRTVRERAVNLVNVAHPKFRDSLMEHVNKTYGKF